MWKSGNHNSVSPDTRNLDRTVRKPILKDTYHIFTLHFVIYPPDTHTYTSNTIEAFRGDKTQPNRNKCLNRLILQVTTANHNIFNDL